MQLLTQCQRKDDQEVTDMKKNIGPQLALYPMPATVIGAMNGDKHIGGEGVLCQRDQKN